MSFRVQSYYLPDLDGLHDICVTSHACTKLTIYITCTGISFLFKLQYVITCMNLIKAVHT